MQGQVVWFTGLSGAGKSTLCHALSHALECVGDRVQTLDGDVIRTELWRDLGFSLEDRYEHNRRLAYLAKLLSGHGITVLVAAISPLRTMREIPRSMILSFCEVFVDAPLSVCERRDPKRLYAKARSGQLPAFTGIGSPYEPPLNPDVVCYTAQESIEESCRKVLVHLMKDR